MGGWAMGKPANILRKQIIAYLERSGWFVESRPTGLFKSLVGSRLIRVAPKGALDLIGCTPEGRYFEIEVKAGDDRLSKEQKARIERLHRFGALAIEARGLDDVVRLVAENSRVAQLGIAWYGDNH
jgi:hypothetical protein